MNRPPDIERLTKRIHSTYKFTEENTGRFITLDALQVECETALSCKYSYTEIILAIYNTTGISKQKFFHPTLGWQIGYWLK